MASLDLNALLVQLDGFSAKGESGFAANRKDPMDQRNFGKSCPEHRMPSRSKRFATMGTAKTSVLAWDYSYVIWLNGLRDGAWRFSSAYPTTTTDMCRYIKISKLVWKI